MTFSNTGGNGYYCATIWYKCTKCNQLFFDANTHHCPYHDWSPLVADQFTLEKIFELLEKINTNLEKLIEDKKQEGKNVNIRKK